jgi:hypothetical protein
MVNGLSPNTTYSFQAKGRDKVNNMLALSAPIMVATGPVDSSDTTPQGNSGMVEARAQTEGRRDLGDAARFAAPRGSSPRGGAC